MDKISIIVPVYNVEKFIRECLDSIVNQTYKNIEVICVDDGSTDNSGKICDEYANKYSIIKVIHKKNGGLSEARNVGIDNATGAYISFIDSDDMVNEDFIKILYFMCINNDCDIAECDYQQFESIDKLIDDNNSENDFICTAQEMQYRLYDSNSVRTIVVWNKLYKKDIFNDLRFRIGKINEDEFIIHELIYKTSNVVLSNKKMYYYRYNINSIMKKQFTIKRYDVLEAHEERLNFYKNRNEIEIYKMCSNKYQLILEDYYYETKKHIKDNKKYLKMLKDKININYNENIKKFGLKCRFKHVIRFYCPILFNIIIYLWKKLKKFNNKKYILKWENIIKYKIYFLFCKIKKQPMHILFGTPIHGNLGDHAIAYVEYKLFDSKRIKVFEVPTYLYDCYTCIKNVPSDAVIYISGGGFMGTQWVIEEKLLHNVVNRFINNKIVVFPQTAYYSNNEIGKNAINNAKIIYNSHSNLYIYAREKNSYNMLKNTFNADVELLPDMVLGMNEGDFITESIKRKIVRKGVLLCFRNDAEKMLTNDDKIIVLNAIKQKYSMIKYTDTVIKSVINKSKRKKELKKKLLEFKKAEIVITDRLHGMIFSAITGTPCIALSNYNYKISGVYEWIKNLDYIKYLDSIDDFEKVLNGISKNENDYDYNKYFEMLFKILE